jgi:hypothetical protein
VPGEVDAQGVVRKISVIPKPYQQPHPPLFQPFSVSEHAFRAVHFGQTEAEAVALLRDTNYRGFLEYFSGFGFGEAFRTAEDDDRYPMTPLPREELTVERLRRVKYARAGTPAHVRAEIGALHTLYGSGGELEWFGWFFDQGFLSWEETQRQVEAFAREIIPHFR